MTTWQLILSTAEKGGDFKELFKSVIAKSFLKSSAHQYQTCEKLMLQQMLLQSCEMTGSELFEYTNEWGLLNFPSAMPSAQKLCSEILYRPSGCAPAALNYIIEHIDKFPKDGEKDGYPITTAIYMGNAGVWDGLIDAFPQSFNPERIIQSIIISEEKKGAQWFFEHQKCQNLDAHFYFNLLSFVCSNHSDFGEHILHSQRDKILSALKTIQDTHLSFNFPFAHRHCSVSQGEGDLAHVLWVCNKMGGPLLLEYLAPFIASTQHLLNLLKTGHFDSAEWLQEYVSDMEIEQILSEIPPNLLDKTAKTSKLYARFMNKRLHQAICSGFKGATDKVVRRI